MAVVYLSMTVIYLAAFGLSLVNLIAAKSLFIMAALIYKLHVRYSSFLMRGSTRGKKRNVRA